jgi:predicted nucleotidyltransferase component of viral defense system
MLKAKAVDFFAHRSGIADGSIAEREVVLTYALDLLHVSGRLARYAFKGGTCIRKVYLGSTGRFSMDLDFTAREPMDAEDAILDLASHVFNQTHHGIEFELSLDAGGWRTTQGGLSYTVQVGYRHDWNDAGGFDLQVSLREQPTLDVEILPQSPQPYFPDLEFVPEALPCLDRHEILAEKVRAAYQRARVRDLHDLHVFSTQPVNQQLLRRLVVIKLWQAEDPFEPDAFFDRLRSSPYDWADLARLIRASDKPDPERIVRQCVSGYSFLRDLTAEESLLAADARAHRERRLWRRLVESSRQMRKGGASR